MLAKVNNQTLAVLANKHFDMNLWAQLFTNPADEFSYQALQQLPLHASPEHSISLLAKATKNQALLSMSLLTLAENYASHEQARNILIKQLTGARAK